MSPSPSHPTPACAGPPRSRSTRPKTPSTALSGGLALLGVAALGLSIAFGAFGSPHPARGPAPGHPPLESFDSATVPFAHLPDPAAGLVAQLEAAAREGGGGAAYGAAKHGSAVYEVEHRVPIGGGQELFVTETFTADAFARFPRRAMLFLSGSAFRGDHWNIPVEGYDGPAMAAERGFFAYTVDYLGVGESTLPADGTEVTFDANKEALEDLLRYIRWRRFVPRIDLVGAGYGGSLAAVLAEDRRRVRSVVMSAMLYDNLVGGPLTDPSFVEMLENAPNGYAFFPGEASLVFANGAPQALLDYILTTQGGFYPAENFLVASRGLPFFDPGVARAPGLILFGRQDGLVGPNGMDQLALDYGRNGALLVVNEAAGHAPRTQSPEIAAWFWRNIWAFVDSDPGFDVSQTSSAGLAIGLELEITDPAAGPPTARPPIQPPAGLPAGIEFQQLAPTPDPGEGETPQGNPWIDASTN